jgi:hypothetical protein
MANARAEEWPGGVLRTPMDSLASSWTNTLCSLEARVGLKRTEILIAY